VKYVVEVPNKMFNGFREGVAFVAGRAEIEDEVLKRVFEKNYGYVVRPLKEEKPKKDEEEPKKKSAAKRKK